MTKDEMLYEMLPTILQDCPARLEACVRHVFRSFKRHEVAVFFKNMEQIAITCEDDPWWNDLLHGKVYVQELSTGTQYAVRIFPETLGKSDGDVQVVVCQELGHLYYLLLGVWNNDAVEATAADEFAFQHGFCAMSPVPVPNGSAGIARRSRRRSATAAATLRG